MAFVDDLAAMQAVIYGELGVPALWTPNNSTAVEVTVLPDQADKAVSLGGMGRQTLSRNVFRLRVAELATVAPSLSPAKGDVLQLLDPLGNSLGRPLAIVDPPSRDDARQTEWTLVCG